MNLKMSKTSAGIVMILIVLSVLMLPVASLEWSQYTKQTHIMTVEGNYVNGTDILSCAVNETTFETNYGIQTVRGSDASPDCAYYGYNGSAPGFARKTVYYPDWITYIGNGTHNVSCDFDVLPEAYTSETIYIEFNADEFDFDCDFLRLTTDADAAPNIQYYSERLDMMYNMNIVNSGVGEYIIIPSIIDRSEWDSNPGKTFYLALSSIDFDVDEFQFKLESFTLTGADAMTWDDEQIYVMVLLGCDMVLIIGFALTTDVIDIAIDRKRKYYRKRR